MRADARRNRERLVEVAKRAFADHGADAPLEDIARRAHVGIGTLYRHFPERTALMAAVFRSELDALVLLSDRLAESDSPMEALGTWLRAVIAHTATYRGLGGALTADGPTSMDICRIPLHRAGETLIGRARQAGQVRDDARVQDLLRLSCAIALVAEKAPEEPDLADRLLGFVLDGLRVPPGPSGGPTH